MAQYISYEDGGQLWDGFLVEDDGVFLKIAEPFCFRWLRETGKTEWLGRFPLRSLLKSDAYWTPKSDAGSFDSGTLWVFEFPLEGADAEEFHHIANFFSHFLYHRGLPLQTRLERSIGAVERMISKGALKRALRFALDKNEGSADRLRIALSGNIKRHLV